MGHSLVPEPPAMIKPYRFFILHYNSISLQMLLFAWAKILVFFIPLLWIGLVVTRRVVSIRRAEVLFLVALPAGITMYIFLLNSLSFFLSGQLGVYSSYLLVILLGVFVSFSTKVKSLDFPERKVAFFFLLFFIVWGVFLFWEAGHAVFGRDTLIYYSIAKSFVRGNFPIVSPWQPDMYVNYHYGASLLIGALHEFTGLPFEFLHRALAFLLLTFVSQFLVWVWRRHQTFFGLLLYQLVPLVAFVSVGSFMLVWPVLPIEFPELGNLREFVIWGRELPSVHISFETYGAPISLELFVYFLHHVVALASFFWIVFLVFYAVKESRYLTRYLFVLGVGISSLALSSESFFLFALAVAGSLIILDRVWRPRLGENLLKVLAVALFFGAVVLLQGGVITDSLLRNPGEPAILFFLKRKIQFMILLVITMASRLLNYFHWSDPGCRSAGIILVLSGYIHLLHLLYFI